MKKEILNHFTNPDWILFSFILFFVVFVIMLLKALFITSAREHQKNSLIPLYEKPNRKVKHHE